MESKKQIQKVEDIATETNQPHKNIQRQVYVKQKGQNWRHFKTLMHKNAINWKRTWFGSIMEFACPLFLMLLLCLFRTLLDKVSFGEFDMYSLQRPLFPAASLSAQTDRWTVNSNTVAQSSAELKNFFTYTEYPGLNDNGTYNATNDERSPFNFMPAHCYVPNKAYNSPIVAYIPQGNDIEADLVQQMEALFALQKSQQVSEGTNLKNAMNGNFTVQAFESQDSLWEYIMDKDFGLPQKPAVCFAFKIIENSKRDYEIELFFNDLWPSYYQSLPNQKKKGAEASIQAPLTTEYSLYMKEGYNLFLNWAANAVLKEATGKANAQITTMVVPFKAKPATIDSFTQLLLFVMPFFFMLMYVPLLYRTVYRIVFEKVTRAKESMRMMGMSDFSYWSSWLCYYTLVNTLLSTLCWGVLMINVLDRSSSPYIWTFIWIYGQSLFGLIVITQSLFSSPRAAAITTTIIYWGSAILSGLVNEEDILRADKIGISIFFPTVAMWIGFQPLIQNSQSGVGVNANTLWIEYFNFSVGDGLYCMIVGGLIMILLGFYLELVLPKEYGKRRHPCFCFMFCCTKKRIHKVNQSLDSSSLQKMDEANHETKYLDKESYEAVPREVAQKEEEGRFLKISDLEKVYDNGFKAVNGVNLKFYADQIFVLLGHNGAGKTTTISMLTGLFEQSKGMAELFGIDMFNDMDSVRQIMGVCPQHDVLFELLTVYEHVSFFYDLKGADPNPKYKKAQISKLLQDVGVWDKRNSLAYQLSGGNKRKLSVAIALCGDSKFVLLDEPTSGMDLSARRQMWDMLKEQKKGRIIVLTTHYMDEADILGDRIGIMSSGKVTALGSSIFLKTKFGVGYNLTLVKKNTNPNPEVIAYMEKHLGPNIIKQSEIQSEMTIQIPVEYAQNFGSFFKSFDEDLDQLNVMSYGISISTLEEVFLKVGSLHSPVEEDLKKIVRDVNELDDLEDGKSKGGPEQIDQVFNMKDNVKELDNSFLNNLKAILYKRTNGYKRNKKALINEVLVPALFMIAGIALTKRPRNWQSDSRIQTPDRLPLPQALMFNPNAVISSSDVSMIDLATNLPSDAFEVKYSAWNKTSRNQNVTTFKNFGDQVFDHGQQNSDVPPYQYGSYEIYEADSSTQNYKFISWVNLTSQDATALYPQFMYESILKVATKDPSFSFKVRSSPYPPTNFILSRIELTGANAVIFITAIAYSIIIVSIVSYLVVERTNGLKHLQVISGMQLKAYWIGNFLFDFLKFEVTIVATIILFFAFEMGFDNAWVTYLVLPFGILPFTYVSSFVFSQDSAAQTFTMFFHFFILGIVSIIVYFVRFSATLQDTGDALNIIFHIVPTYALGPSLFCDLGCQDLANARKSPQATGKELDPEPWGNENIKFDVWSMYLHFVFWTIQLILIEKGFWKFCQRDPNTAITSEALQLDEDVMAEAARVKTECKDVIQVKDFKKVYRTYDGCISKSVLAVSELNFGLTSGECFALLGVNGAGKSTTFKSLTCETKPSKGKISIAGLDIQKQFDKARKLIGYCPQPNLIFDEMSVEEHLYFYVQIKGIPLKKRQILIEQSIEQLGLSTHRTKPAGTLSGGNKRKLCVALAILGNPPIIFLDEPSAGMDPESRRFMWSVVGNIAQKKTSAVVLTTHSMDEAEALSTKMGIMVKGGIFKCFGSAQHIKNKFGTGYVIEIKIKTLEQDDLRQVQADYHTNGVIDFSRTKFDDNVKNLISNQLADLSELDYLRQIHGDVNLYSCILELCQTFETVELLEKYGCYMRVRVARLDKSIGYVFGLVEAMKANYSVSEYSVSQTTLEQIFQSFADIKFTEKVQKFRIITNRYLDHEQHILSVENAQETAKELKQ